jgi:hypothetical protein
MEVICFVAFVHFCMSVIINFFRVMNFHAFELNLPIIYVACVYSKIYPFQLWRFHIVTTSMLLAKVWKVWEGMENWGKFDESWV